jgi:hypothetical protein
VKQADERSTRIFIAGFVLEQSNCPVGLADHELGFSAFIALEHIAAATP